MTEARRHNHFTRDIKPQGACPACDDYWATVPLKRGAAADRLIVDDSDGLRERRDTMTETSEAAEPQSPTPTAIAAKAFMERVGGSSYQQIIRTRALNGGWVGSRDAGCWDAKVSDAIAGAAVSAVMDLFRQWAEECDETDDRPEPFAEYRQSTTACCPRQTIPDSCGCLEGCHCCCQDCDCGTGCDCGDDED